MQKKVSFVYNTGKKITRNALKIKKTTDSIESIE
jgi:hypothetical protein